MLSALDSFVDMSGFINNVCIICGPDKKPTSREDISDICMMGMISDY